MGLGKHNLNGMTRKGRETSGRYEYREIVKADNRKRRRANDKKIVRQERYES